MKVLGRRLAVGAAAWALRQIAKPCARRFREALLAPHEAQSALLSELTAAAASTAYGRYHGIYGAVGYEEFRRRLPIIDYEDIAPWIEHQMRLEQRVLAPGKILFYEKTSGSTGAAKKIPYTAALRDSYARMFLIWASDVLSYGPKLTTGRFYFSVSPAVGEVEVSAKGRPINLEDDSGYLPGWLGLPLEPFFVRVRGLRGIESSEEFRRVLVLALLREEALEIVSIWNPTYLTSVLRHVEAHRETILRALHGELAPFRRKALEASTIDWHAVWPHLKILSCWDQGAARSEAERLAALFPRALIQGKGLLATEAPVSLPLLEVGGSVPLVTEVFLEVEAQGEVRPLCEAEGLTGQLIVSQRGGLLRYRLGDLVRVLPPRAGSGKAPVIELVGRMGETCDLVGEKLNATFLREAIGRVGAVRGFHTVGAVRDEQGRYRYALLTESAPKDLAEKLDRELMQAYHYGVARRQGQLEPLEVRVCPDLEERYLAYFTKKGMKLGDIKPTTLMREPLAEADLARHFS